MALGVGWSEEGLTTGHDCGAGNTAACFGRNSCNCTPKYANFLHAKKSPIKRILFVISLRTSPL